MAQEPNKWVLNFDEYSCVKLDATMDELTKEYEAISKARCQVSLMENPFGIIRRFMCGDIVWYVAEEEPVCQKGIQVWKNTADISFWVYSPFAKPENVCTHMPGKIGDFMSYLEQDGKKCSVSIKDPGKEGGVLIKIINCGDTEYVTVESEKECREVEKDFNQFQQSQEI